MDELQRTFIASTVDTFFFLEKEYGYQRLPPIDNSAEDYRDANLIIRYIGHTIAVDIVWFYDSAAIGVEFTELLEGKFPQTRVCWGNSDGKARAIDLYSAVELSGGKTTDFLLGDISSVSFSKVKKREKIVQSKMEPILQNLKDLCVKYASEVIGGDLSIFQSALIYQQNKIEKRLS
jgi:hypothetical protein